MTSWQHDVDTLHGLLCAISFRDEQGREVGAEEGFSHWCERTVTLRREQRAIYLVGNGASAAMASHFAADLAKNGRLHTQVFSDLSLITAISNDIGYEHVFAEPLRRRGNRGDMLVAISSSGRSPNILAAVETARKLDMTVVTLSGKDADNPLRSSGNLNLYVAATTYGMAETAHAAVLHRWMDLMEAVPK
jgi:D-sedoheptulose 7-phosphate isomerase